MKIPAFTPTEASNGKWVLNIPANFSSTGKRRRLFFNTDTEAKAEAKRVKRLRKEHGTKAEMIDADLAIDARKAEKVLSEYPEATLLAAAKFYAAHLKAQADSVTYNELVALQLVRIEGRSGSHPQPGMPRC